MSKPDRRFPGRGPCSASPRLWFSKERGFQPKATDDDLLDGKKPVRYSRWLDFSTATFADPKANPSGDGKSNLEHYLEQSDPARPPAPHAPGDKNDEVSPRGNP